MPGDSFTAPESKPSTIGKYILLAIIAMSIMLGGNYLGVPYAMRIGITAGVVVLCVLAIKASSPQEESKF